MNPSEYNPQIPESDNNIAESQSNFLGNFSTLFAAFGQNHVDLSDATNPGNHEVIQLVEQPVGKSTESQEISIYSKEVSGQTDQLFMRYPVNGKEFQITNYQIYSIQQTQFQKAFFSFLPGGIMVYFGTAFSNGTNEFNIVLNPPPQTNVMGINLGGKDTIGLQPNVSLVQSNGRYVFVNLKSVLPMPDQFYLVFANL